MFQFLPAAMGIGRAIMGGLKAKGKADPLGMAGSLIKGAGAIAGGVRGARQQGVDNRLKQGELDVLRQRFGLDQQKFGHEQQLGNRTMAINEGRFADERANAGRLAENDSEMAPQRARMLASLMQRFGVR